LLLGLKCCTSLRRRRKRKKKLAVERVTEIIETASPKNWSCSVKGFAWNRTLDFKVICNLQMLKLILFEFDYDNAHRFRKLSLSQSILLIHCLGGGSIDTLCWLELISQISQSFHYKKEDSPSHQNIGTCMEY
jgi:hypothetical protein